MSAISIVSTGMVTPLALGAVENAFLVRAGMGVPAPAAFETADGDPVDVLCCGFLGAALPLGLRLARLAEIAAHQALEALPRLGRDSRAALALVMPRRPEVDAATISDVKDALAKQARSPVAPALFHDEAGAFAALARATAWLEAGAADAVLLVGVDSFVSPEVLTAERRRGPSYWCPPGPPPAEGAAAVLLARSPAAQQARASLARVNGHGTLLGPGSDDDDVTVDGSALTSLIRGLGGAPIGLVVGQQHTDDLRGQEWHLAGARNASRWASNLEVLTLERAVGRLGAAAGVAQLAYGSVVLRHGIVKGIPSGALALAWAISRDGHRGAALLQGGRT